MTETPTREEMLQASRGETVSPTVGESEYEDYFGFSVEEKFYLPDGKQHILFRIMNEGQRTKYQKRTNSDIKVNRKDENVTVRTDQAGERQALIEESVTGWFMVRRNSQGDFIPVDYSVHNFRMWMNDTNPKLIDDLELAIRKANPWMQADMSIEEIDKEIDRLREMRQQVEEEQAKKSVTAN